MSFRMVPDSMTLNDFELRILIYRLSFTLPLLSLFRC